MTATARPRRPGAARALRAQERREVARQSPPSTSVDTARLQLVEHLEAARFAALEGRLVTFAAEITTLIRKVQQTRGSGS